MLGKLCGGALAIAFFASASAPIQAAPLVVPDLGVSAQPNEDLIQVRHGGGHKEIKRGRRPSGHHGRPPNAGHRPGGPGWNGNHPGYRPGHPGYRPGHPGYRPGHPGYRPGYRPGYWNGYHGYNYYRPGYRYYNGWWYPLAAFGVGAAVGSAVTQPSYNYSSGGYSSAHYEWCANRYRSYRASDNTFQPNSGPRRQCVSPY
ncbi:BA14K family protein [Kaistia sp. K-TC2]|uniref:Lectin-like protein BA14k n=1 Tax=Kaistia nematophila TaxID=2994654 RepID=A0A9X3IK12_9HYPH|nr:BA14K family protein [Kaistia nematophila]